ncbi:apoptotic chromatin condensation inducer in the nucleus-like protein isoform X1 [Tanacetum coccineum]
MGSPKKLNLDPSSGDDSMEEDVLETKQIDSECSSQHIGDINEKTQLPPFKEGEPLDAMAAPAAKNDETAFAALFCDIAEVAVLEEEVVRLEEEIVSFKQGLYQEPVLISSKINSGNLDNDSMEKSHTSNQEESRSLMAL